MGSIIERIKSPDIKESEYITGRSLFEYETRLGFRRNLLEGQTVLNFGCGGSNLSNEIKRRGIQAYIVDLDLANDPVDKTKHLSYKLLAPSLNLIDNKFTQNNSELHQKIVNLKRRLGGIYNRNFVQSDGRHLPFADQTFDTTLALSSNYQVPDEDREQIWRELLRVSKTVHAGPVNGIDYAILQKLAEEQEYNIVYSQDRLPRWRAIKITTTEDYETYMEQHPPKQRITVPPTLPTQVHTRFGRVISASAYGNLVILRRKHTETSLSSDEQNRVGYVATGTSLVAA